MVLLTSLIEVDPTLAAADKAIELKESEQRDYLGMSSIGDSCSRKLWYSFRHAKKEKFSAKTLKMFEDGHRTEELIIDRLKNVTLIEGQQKSYSDFSGHFQGHNDGIISGLIQHQKHRIFLKLNAVKKLINLRKQKLMWGKSKL